MMRCATIWGDNDVKERVCAIGTPPPTTTRPPLTSDSEKHPDGELFEPELKNKIAQINKIDA
ncbi:hypothetical protein NECAME_02946 [Necator americanus]|uniref:Uncharacterized protein n=1 Tax=Necator americanus TaxID=51031 RepID=W2T8A3_NECAM|nr:hypothetical protein NECAME_02946 [Necator americanus]ETN78240.1 hypothetical protein NECAME_02946 [Necator americanus]